MQLFPYLTTAPAPILILAALEAEAAPVRAALTDLRPTLLHGLALEHAALGGQPVALALCGIGKVNAALSAALLIAALHPAAVLMSGVAGALAPHLAVGDVVLGAATAQHDYGRRYADHYLALAPFDVATSARHPPRFIADPAWLTRAATATLPAGTALQRGTIVSGDTLVIAAAARLALHQQWEALACDMESAAVAQVCAQLAVPFLAVRAISDTDEAAPLPPEDAVRLAAGNAAAVTLAAIGAAQSDG